MKNIFLICPVRNATEEQIKRMRDYISKVKANGDNIYYPNDDNAFEHTDDVGYIICDENRRALLQADEIHIFWDKTSSGSLFDLGMAFASNKKLIIVNAEELEITPHKSFSNMINEWSNKSCI